MTVLYVGLKYEPPKYWVEEVITKRRFWFDKHHIMLARWQEFKTYVEAQTEKPYV
jgi:hypothetical protein